MGKRAMRYERVFRDKIGGIQNIGVVGGSVIVAGEGARKGDSEAFAFPAESFRSADIQPNLGKVDIHVDDGTTSLRFGAKRGVAFTLDTLLEAVETARAEE